MEIEKIKPINDIPKRPLKNPIPNPGKDIDQGKIIDDIFKSALDKDISYDTGFHNGPRSRRSGYALIMWSWVAAFIDTLLMISLSCFFLASFSFLMKSSGAEVLHTIKANHSLITIFAGIFVVGTWIYMITLRILIGSSIGEWACGLRLGKPHERMTSNYPFKVIIRESLIVSTGIFLLPVLSLLFGTDLVGKISGLKLFSLK